MVIGVIWRKLFNNKALRSSLMRTSSIERRNGPSDGSFYKPRLVHFRSQYEPVPGRPPIEPWHDRKPSVKQRLVRWIFFRRKQAASSALGLSKLPYELLDRIFRNLCGREICSVRRVCVEWEVASRAFFAAQCTSRSVFWLTYSSLRMLDDLSRKFGPYMSNIYIATDHVTIAGLVKALLAYHSRAVQDVRGHYFQQWSKLKGGSTIHHDSSQTRRFVWQYACNIVSQWYLGLLGRDITLLARTLDRAPRSDVQVVILTYEPEQLNENARTYGMAAPGYAFQLALYCSGQRQQHDEAYHAHVQRVVDEAVQRKSLLTSAASANVVDC